MLRTCLTQARYPPGLACEAPNGCALLRPDAGRTPIESFSSPKYWRLQLASSGLKPLLNHPGRCSHQPCWSGRELLRHRTAFARLWQAPCSVVVSSPLTTYTSTSVCNLRQSCIVIRSFSAPIPSTAPAAATAGQLGGLGTTNTVPSTAKLHS